jgi:hypothetical protein
MKGSGIGKTRIRNDIINPLNSPCILSIMTDNIDCKLDIMDITFE